MAVIYTFQDTEYGPHDAPKVGYTVFYDHLGNKLYSFKTGSRVSSKSKKMQMALLVVSIHILLEESEIVSWELPMELQKL